MWDHAEGVMMRVLEEIKARHGNVVTTALNPGEGAFYGPKFEYVLRDAIGRDWQCGTTQVDFNLPERFGAFYIAPTSEKTTPVMVHRAICGSMERFTGILIEHYAGHLPLWLAPLQIVVCTITQEADDYAMEIVAAARKLGLRVEADLRNEKISYKVREHSLAKMPVLVVVGRKEASERTVSIRRLGSNEQRAESRSGARRLRRGGGAARSEGGAGGRRGRVKIVAAVLGIDAAWTERNDSGFALIEEFNGSWRLRIAASKSPGFCAQVRSGAGRRGGDGIRHILRGAGSRGKGARSGRGRHAALA